MPRRCRSLDVLQGQADVVEAVQQAVLAEGSTSKGISPPSGPVITCVLQIDRDGGVAPRSASSISWSTCSCGSAIGRMPFLKQLLKKMSAKLGAMTQRMPKSSSAQGACSRARAAAEVLAGDQDLRLAVGRLVQHEVGVLLPSGVVAHLVEQVLAEARPLDRLQELLGDDHVGVDVDHRQRGGDRRSGVVNFSIFRVLLRRVRGCRSGGRSPPRPRPSPGSPGGCGRHGPGGLRSCGWRCEAQRSPRLELVGVHGRGTWSSRARAIRSRLRLKIWSRPSSSACCFTRPEPGTTIAYDAVGDLAALGDGGGRAQILDAAVGAGADEDAVDLHLVQRRAGRQAHVFQRALDRPGACPRRRRRRDRARVPVIGSTSCGLVPQVTCGTMSSAFSTTSLS